MRKVKATTIRNGIYQSNFTVPDDLRGTKYGKGLKPQISLKTSDHHTAKVRVAEELLKFEERIIEARRRKEGNLPPWRLQQSRDLKPLKDISSLSVDQKEDLVSWHYTQLEARAVDYRVKVSQMDHLDRDEALSNLIFDWEFLVASEAHSRGERKRSFIKFLEQNGLSVNAASWDEDFFSLFIRSEIESLGRTLDDMSQRGTVGPFKGKLFTPVALRFDIKNSQKSVPDFSKSVGKTVNDLCSEFIEAKSEGKAPKTVAKYKLHMSIMEEFLGAETPLSDLAENRLDTGKGLIEFSKSLPVRSTIVYRGKSFREAARLEALKKDPNLLHPKSVEEIFINLKACFDFAVRLDWMVKNPMDGLREYLPPIIERETQMMTGEEMTKIFSSDEFCSQKAGGSNQCQKGRYWATLLTLFHGMRVDEAASIWITDVKEESGIHFLDLSFFNEQGDSVKRLKTKSSQRRIPIHKDVIKLGFLDYVNEQRELGVTEYLFSDIKAKAKGDSVSKWFLGVRDKIIGKPEGIGDKSLRSFRHSVATEIRKITQSDEILYAIGGWTSGSANSSRRYGKQSLLQMKEVVDQIKFDDFEPSCLQK